jgi:hypothetical protein
MRERRATLRRAAYLTALLTTCGAFALSLVNIAGTEGRVRPAAGTELVRAVQHGGPGHCDHARPTTPAVTTSKTPAV